MTRLSARKSEVRFEAPIAFDTVEYQAGSIVAEVPTTGIIFPPLSCFTSERNVASDGPSASVKITCG